MIAALVLGCLLAAFFGGRVGARVWTSTSGATVEADFIKEEWGYAVLEREDGSRIKIETKYLVPEDREHIRSRNTAGEAGEKQLSEEEIAGIFGVQAGREGGQIEQVGKDEEDGRKQAEPGGGPKEGEREKSFLDKLRYAKAIKIKREDFKGLDLKHPDNASFIALQYGPGAKDVLFLAFDREDREDLPKEACVYDAAAENTLRNSYKLKGRKGRREYDETEYRVSRFDDISVAADYGEVDMQADLEFYFGMGGVDQVYMLAEVELIEKGSREGVSFHLWGPIIGGEGVADKTIASVPLLGRMEIDFSIAYRKIFGLVKMNEFEFAPEKIPNGDMLVVVKDDEGKEVEDEEIDWDEDAFFADRYYGMIKWYEPDEFDEPGEYTVECSMDLGPLLGSLKGSEGYTIN